LIVSSDEPLCATLTLVSAPVAVQIAARQKAPQPAETKELIRLCKVLYRTLVMRDQFREQEAASMHPPLWNRGPDRPPTPNSPLFVSNRSRLKFALSFCRERTCGSSQSTLPDTSGFTYTAKSFGNPSKLHLFHSDGTGWVDVTTSLNTGTHVICGTVSSLSPFAISESRYSAAVQRPINVDGSSMFNANRGVVPVKFTLSIDNALTCQLPTAMISLVRTAGSIPGTVNESDYVLSSDNGPNFRIDSCQYVYNLESGSLGSGSYTVSILIGREPVGSGSFRLR
jgi:hypothetical protein